MKVLVTGGAGYLGNFVVEELLNRGHDVRVLDSLLFGERALEPFNGNGKVEFRRGDVRHIEDLTYAIRGMEAVIHLASIVGDPACSVNEQATQSTNVEATKAIIEICKLHNVQRFIFASSCSVYGANEPISLNEGSCLNPLSLYAKTKIESERIIFDATKEHNSDGSQITPVVLRLATLFGLSRRMRFDLVVNILTAKAVLEGEVPVYGGEQYRPLLHVRDAARAFVFALEAPKERVGHQIFNVGDNGLNYRIKEVGEMVTEAIPKAKLKIIESKDDQRSYKVSFDKANYVLGWKAEKGIPDGVLEIEKKLENGEIGDYREPVYRNSTYEYM